MDVIQVWRILCHAQVRSGHCGVSGDDWHLTESAGLHEVSDSAAVNRRAGALNATQNSETLRPATMHSPMHVTRLPHR